MDAECDGSDSAFKTCTDVVSSLYEKSYLKSFLPVYQIVNQSKVSSICDRYKAIRFAADAALAVTASGASWSEALNKKLEDACGERGKSVHLVEARLCKSPETNTTSDTISTEQASPGSTGTSSSMDERSILGRRRGLRADSVLLRRGLFHSFSLRSLMTGSRSNWCRSHLWSRDASRLAVLRKLCLRTKSRRRSLRSCWKPRKSLRKVKSLAKTRSRSWNCQRPVTTRDPLVEERRFDNRLVALQQLIPGGDSMDATVLLDEAADFVMFLKMQVQALQSVCNAVEMREQLDQLVPEF